MKRIGLLIAFFSICTSNLLAQGTGVNYQFDLEVDGLDRQYTLYVPEGYDGSEEWPVVICLHGFTCTIHQMQEMTKLYQVADTAKFFIVYPQGLNVFLKWFGWTGTGWNTPDYTEADQDDVFFISRIIDDLYAKPDYSIDLRRIHATGQSAGGMMAYYLAFVLSNKIASVAGIPGQMSDTLINHICSPTRPISVLHMQGTSDWAFPVDGNKICLPLEGVTAYWADVNGCDAIPDSLELDDIDKNDSSTVTLFNYNNCDDGLEVLLYRINGGGHTWPGGFEDPAWGWGSDIINMDINASTEIWNFFKRNPHPNPWVEIPDTAFLHALIDEGVDANDDSLISYAEAEATTSLDVNEKNISDITGIEAFVNLDTLECRVNQLTSLDVSNNTALSYLTCGYNPLTSLDVSNNTALTFLECFLNQLTSLDVSSCNALEWLACNENQLTSLDVSDNAALIQLWCNDNQLTSLAVSNNTDLTGLSCYNNQLTSLDVSKNNVLEWLYCGDNQLTRLDVSNNTALSELDLSNMPTLEEVCVWEGFSTDNLNLDTTGSPNAYFTTDCAVNIPGDYKENSTIDIYPNPSDDIINIEIKNINDAIIEIYNVSGKLVLSKALNSKVEKIDISGFLKGIYIVKVMQEQDVKVGKLIVY